MICERALSSSCLPGTFFFEFSTQVEGATIFQSSTFFSLCSITDVAICAAPFKSYPKSQHGIQDQQIACLHSLKENNKLCVCDVKPPSSRVFVHAKKRKKLVTNVIYGMQLASENNKKSVQQRCGSIGNQYSTRMMIPTCNRPYRFWTSSRLLFCSVWVVFLSGRYEDAWREPYVWAPGQPVDVIVKVSGKKKIQGLIFIFLFLFVFSLSPANFWWGIK